MYGPAAKREPGELLRTEPTSFSDIVEESRVSLLDWGVYEGSVAE